MSWNPADVLKALDEIAADMLAKADALNCGPMHKDMHEDMAKGVRIAAHHLVKNMTT